MHVRVSARQSHCATEVQINGHCQIALWHKEPDSGTFDLRQIGRKMSIKSYLGTISGAKRLCTNNIAQLLSVCLNRPVKEEENEVGTEFELLRKIRYKETRIAT